MNSVCNKFSQYYPEYWDSANYTGIMYVLIQLPRNSSEFFKVARNFPWPIQTVSRIQNPLAYLRYTLQGEYLLHQVQKGTVNPLALKEYVVYHPVFNLDADSAICYNCDKRHYTNPQGNFFINTLILPFRKDNVVIVLLKRGDINEITYTKDHYPMYLLKMPPLLLTFGNPLMDISVNISDSSLLEKYGLREDDQKEIESEVIEAILKDVSTSLQELPDLPNGRCICFVHGAHRSLVANIGAASHFTLDFLKTSKELRNLINEASVVYIEGFFVSDRFPVCQYLVEHVQNGMDKILAYNLSACYVCEELADESGYMAEHADIVFANSREYETLGRKRYGLQTAEECAMKLHEIQRSRNLSDDAACTGRLSDDATDDVTKKLKNLGKLVVVTRDSEAVLIIWGRDKCQRELVPVHRLAPEEIVDTTGAGDAFVGGFFYALLHGRSPRAAARFACKTATAIIGNLGAEPPDCPPPKLDDTPDEETTEE